MVTKILLMLLLHYKHRKSIFENFLVIEIATNYIPGRAEAAEGRLPPGSERGETRRGGRWR